MGIGWILGLFGVGGMLGFGALAFFAPQTIPAIMSVVKNALTLAAPALRWLVFTAAGRQVLLASLVILAFWWSGQRGWDRGTGWQARQDAPRLALARANEAKLSAGLDRCNASIADLGAKGRAATAAAQAAIAKARAAQAALSAARRRLAAVPASKAVCPSVDAIFKGAFGP